MLCLMPCLASISLKIKLLNSGPLSERTLTGFPMHIGKITLSIASETLWLDLFLKGAAYKNLLLWSTATNKAVYPLAVRGNETQSTARSSNGLLTLTLTIGGFATPQPIFFF